MARHFSARQLTILALGICLAATWSVQNAQGTDYVWSYSGFVDGPDWNDTDNWTPSGVPNSSSDTATINRPPSPSGGNLTIEIVSPVTVSALTIDNTSAAGELFAIGPPNSELTFEADSGAASYTETAGTGTGQVLFYPDFTVLSDTVMTYEFRSDSNSSSEYFGTITGASDRTIIKEGLANLQLVRDTAGLFADPAAFEGQYVINNGALRFLGRTNLELSTGITVNAGGQLQINSNDTAVTYDWNLANGAVLTLNGPGKSGGSAPGGALRFQGQAGQENRHATFHNEVVLLSDTTIAGGPAAVTGELDNVVSGAGGLTKNGPATLIISNPASSYDGDTSVDQGTLSLTNPILSNSSDVYLASAGILNLSYTGTDIVNSLFLDDVAQAVGLWGATGNGLADFTTDLITGDGLLDVQSPGSLPGDYNSDNVVDAADYVLWRKDPDSFGGDPDGYNTWVDNYGATAGGGSGALDVTAVVPEPGTGLLALFALSGLIAVAARR
jgi:fibronectin-binding autotransporter adhesin